MKDSELMRKVAQVAPDKYGFIVKTAEEVRESPFRDEILSRLDSLIKKAEGFGNRWAQFSQNHPYGSKAVGALGGGAAAVGGAALGGVAYALAGDMYDAVKRGLTKGRDYKNMMQDNPDLKALPAKQVQKAFSVLHKFAPDYAGDPTVAGSFVRRSANFPEDAMFGDPKMLKELIDSRKNLTETKRLPGVPEIRDSRSKSLDMKHKGLQIAGLQHEQDPDVMAYATHGEDEKRQHARNEEERRQRKFEWEAAGGHGHGKSGNRP